MSEKIELEIKWDGPVKGLEAHRVSLKEFAPALTALVSAARRIASNLVSNAGEPADRGRLAKAATNLDIEISDIVKGSGGFLSQITFDFPVSNQAEMFNILSANVGMELLEAISAESSGTHRNSAVRNYLELLPTALTSQSYKLREGEREIKSVVLGKMNLPEVLSEPLPSFLDINGRVTGVSFEPKWEVRVRGEGVSQLTAIATERQVNRALDMRASEVRAISVSSVNGTRLVVLENEAMQSNRPSLDDIFSKWDATFRALA